jgi:hypothetical protein
MYIVVERKRSVGVREDKDKNRAAYNRDRSKLTENRGQPAGALITMSNQVGQFYTKLGSSGRLRLNRGRKWEIKSKEAAVLRAEVLWNVPAQMVIPQ